MPTLDKIFIWMVFGTSLTGVAAAAGGAIGLAHTMSVLATLAVGLRIYHDRVVVPLQQRVLELERQSNAK